MDILNGDLFSCSFIVLYESGERKQTERNLMNSPNHVGTSTTVYIMRGNENELNIQLLDLVNRNQQH